jgi:hypothetical protein
MGYPHVHRLIGPLSTIPASLPGSFFSFRVSFEEMVTSASDASFASAVHAGPWWRHRGALLIIYRYYLHLDATPSARCPAFEFLSLPPFDHRLYQWLQLISRQW